MKWLWWCRLFHQHRWLKYRTVNLNEEQMQEWTPVDVNFCQKCKEFRL